MTKHADEQADARSSKYNVSKDAQKRSYDGIVFDSCMEMRYYRDVVLPLSRSGEITQFELQKPFELQPSVRVGDRLIRAIVYVADFYIVYQDGHEEVIDIKGCADHVSKLKRKMFWYRYPDIPYRWLTYVAKWGGWLDYDEVNSRRRKQKKEQKNNAD